MTVRVQCVCMNMNVLCVHYLWQRDWLLSKPSVSISEDAQQGPSLDSPRSCHHHHRCHRVYLSSSCLSTHSCTTFATDRMNHICFNQIWERAIVWTKGESHRLIFNEQQISLLRLFRMMSWWNWTLSLSSVCSLRGHSNAALPGGSCSSLYIVTLENGWKPSTEMV